MSSVNKVMLLGNLGKDPEIRYLASGMATASVSLATSTKRKDKDTGESIEETQWHRLVFWDRLAEIAGEYLTKGSTIFVEGSLKYGKYEKDGHTNYTTDIVVSSMQMIGSKKDRDGGGERQQPGRQQPEPQQREPQQRQQPERHQRPAQTQHRDGGAPGPQVARTGGGSGFDDMDDDIPFRDPLSTRGFHLAI
jgi:single-strand DNA-binding protein